MSISIQQQIDYALMAGASYISNRPDENKFPTPNGWSPTQYKIKDSGFEAISFTKGTETVISFAGTDFSLPGIDDLMGSDTIKLEINVIKGLRTRFIAGTRPSFKFLLFILALHLKEQQ